MGVKMFSGFLQIGLTDIIDIFFFAVLLYTAIVWVQRTRAAFVIRGIFILGAVYILARQLDLKLTTWIFQGFFAILLIIVVVIFQEELRQIFERVAVWSLGRKGAPALRSGTLDILVRTLVDLAKEKIGALIVVRGNDPMERHIVGGIQLDGRLSEPLLKSVFDPHSPGHDGAVIVERDRLSRFAAHLPLSEDFQQLSSVGTRHSAALGLAELTDALCLVVSEERGQISIARDGTLRQIDNPQQLRSLVHEFLQEKYPTRDQSKISVHLLRENWFAKVVALSLTVALWYIFVPGSKTIEATYKIPVNVENLPHNLYLDTVDPPEINATFTGPQRAFYLFDPKKLKLTVDASLAELGRRTFTISDQDLRHPKDLTIQELTPTTLKISVKKLSVTNEKKPAGGQTTNGKEE